MRNVTRNLTVTENNTAAMAYRALTGPFNGKHVTVEYVNRETGEAKDLTGALLEIVGEKGMSNLAGRFQTDRGFRTVSLWLVESVSLAGVKVGA